MLKEINKPNVQKYSDKKWYEEATNYNFQDANKLIELLSMHDSFNCYQIFYDENKNMMMLYDTQEGRIIEGDTNAISMIDELYMELYRKYE
ncbi:MAG: hypothetical protein ACRDD7_04725 [Peptostreptococcaceae bacterium]